MPARILVIDPQYGAQQLLALNVRQAGHDAVCAPDAAAAWRAFDADLPDLIVLEWDLAGPSGLVWLAQLRARTEGEGGSVPVIVTGARCAEHDKVRAFECGADDYMTKPLGLRELLARIDAILRRRPPRDRAAMPQAGLRLDPGTLRVTAGSRPLALGRLEFRLLHCLMQHPGRVYSRAQLLDHVWGRDVLVDERTVDAHVGRLRGALQASGHDAHIETVRGSGYRFLAGLAELACIAADAEPASAPPAVPRAACSAMPACARPLSGREMEILYWVGEGKSNDEAGQILGISGVTVKNHLQRIYQALGVSNRAQAVARGMALRGQHRQHSQHELAAR